MLCSVDSKFVFIITEYLNSLKLMLENDLLYRLYDDDFSFRCSNYINDYVKALTFKNFNMIVFEIGSNIKGATISLLQSLDREGILFLQRYDFIDVSSEFFDKVRKGFKNGSRL